MLTKRQKAAYLRTGGIRCPYCGSEDMEGEGVQSGCDGNYRQRMTCHGCGRWWVDVYTLTGMDEADDEGRERESFDGDEAAEGPDAVAVLAEFVGDVDAVGIAGVERDWPDLAATYRKAKGVIDGVDPVPELSRSMAGREILVDYDLLDEQIGALSHARNLASDKDAMLLEGLLELLGCIHREKPFAGCEGDRENDDGEEAQQ